MTKFDKFSFLIVSIILVVWAFVVKGEDAKPDPCQQEFYDPEGTILSPDFPENYPNDQSCVYRILTNKMINVNFERFSIEESEDCAYDFLNVIFNASAPSADPQRYCGDGLGKVNDGHLRGQGPLIIAFVSDESDNLRGFKFSFEFELNGPDPCESDPCQNGGECKTYPAYYLCNCTDGFVGVNCELDHDDCASFPCENGGKCVDGVNDFTCECIYGYEGKICDIKPDRCDPEPCENGGLCIDRDRDFVCSCPNDFMGDRCEQPIPTPPPKESPTTTSPPPSPTPSPAPASSHSPPSPEEEEPTKSDNEEKPTTNQPKNDDADVSEDQDTDQPQDDAKPNDDPGNNEVNLNDGSTPSSNSHTTAVVITVLVLLLALLLLGGFAWYWWKYQRKANDEKPNREVTLINMKTKSERGEGKNGKRLSRTTSINSVTMKGGTSDGGDHIIDKLKKISEDIIMEEITDDSQSTDARPQRPIVVNERSPPDVTTNPSLNQHVDKSSPPAQFRQSLMPVDPPPLKRISIPITQNELNKMTNDQSNFNGSYNNLPSTNEKPHEPYRLSPDAAVNLLNQLKQNKGKDFDYRSALEKYGQTEFPRKPFDNSFRNTFTFGSLQPKQDPPTFPTNNIFGKQPQEQRQSFPFQLPNVPLPSNPPSNNQVSYADPPFETGDKDEEDDDEVMELSPEEAADIVNHFLLSEPEKRDRVSSREAMDIIRKVRNSRNDGGGRPHIVREKSVAVNPHDMADFMNKFREQPNSVNNGDDKNSVLPSTYDPSESVEKYPFRMSRDFRECTPIREESDACGDRNTQEDKKQNGEEERSVVEEPAEKRIRKRPRRFPYAKSLDPQEKVHDWLKNTPKQKLQANKYKSPPSPVESIGTETQTITRPQYKPSHDENEDLQDLKRAPEPHLTDKDIEETKTSRSIKQTRRVVPDNQHMLPITENKAKSLVEKLIKAPARSNKNVVGPGLGVSRENAFVGSGIF